MKNAKVFTHRSLIATTLDKIISYHADRMALQRLTPPPMSIHVAQDTRRSLTEGMLAFNLRLGPIQIPWIAEHGPGPTENSFKDRMKAGPMAIWEHDHIFNPVESGVELIDQIIYSHRAGPSGWLTRLIFDGLPLRLLFVFRHWRTRKDLSRSDYLRHRASLEFEDHA